MSKQELNLDNKLLSPIKNDLEKIINGLMCSVINDNKEAEINLKISIDKDVKEKYDKDLGIVESWVEPRINYSIVEKIKGYRETRKGTVGFNFKITQQEDKFITEEINKQESLFNDVEEEDQ